MTAPLQAHHLVTRARVIELVGCPTCGAQAGRPCRRRSWPGRPAQNHADRVTLARAKLRARDFMMSG